MAAAFELAGEERLEDLFGHAAADLPRTEREHVRVRVLSGPGGAPTGVAKRAADAGHLVRRNADPDAVAAQDDAEIRFTAFSHRTTPLVAGKVFYVAADRSVDRATQQPYYVAMVEADPASLARAGALKLQAGMPAEVFIKGEERTPLDYLTEPVTQVLRRAAREH